MHHMTCSSVVVTIPFLGITMASSAAEGGNHFINVLKSLAKVHPAIQTSLELLKKKATSLAQSYEKLVIEDPEWVAKIESSLSFVSFVLPGHFRSSDIVSELVYFATKMLQLIHDLIYRRKFSAVHEFLWTEKTYLESALTTLEYTEAFLELGASRMWGEPGKWFMIFMLQIFKAVMKIILLYVYDSGIQSSPSLLFIREKSKLNEHDGATDDGSTKGRSPEDLENAWQEAQGSSSRSETKKKPDVWSGKRSGRIVRSLKSAPPKGFRDWKMPAKPADEPGHGMEYYKSNGQLSYTEKTAELAYILRPLAHLSSMFVFGESSWKPWLLSLAIDVSSIHQLQSKKVLHKRERDEMMRRKASLLIYLLRSPFYDNYSKRKVISLLDSLAKWVPGMKLVSKPLKEYLPVWQKMYSHNWSS